MANFQSKTKVKVVGYTDGALSTVIVIQIICGIFSTGVIPNDSLQTTNTHDGYINQQIDDQESKKDREIITFLVWFYHSVCVLGGIIAFLAATALVMSTRPHTGQDRAVEILRFWMHCNVFNIILSIVKVYIAVLFIIFYRDYQIWPSILTFVYLGFRIAFTMIIRKELKATSSNLIYTPDQNLVEEMRVRTDELNKRYIYYGKFRRTISENRVPDTHLALPLRPYRGAGLNALKCKCVAPQTV